MNNNDESLVRPPFRALYGVLSLVGIAIIVLTARVIYSMWNDNVFEALELNKLVILIISFIIMLCGGICFTYTGFIVAKSGKPPKYLLKYVDRYKQKENKSV